jgi:hypothetical protein
MITGWKEGCDTVNAIKAIRDNASIPLNESLAIVNRVLHKEPASVPIPSTAVGQTLVNILTRLGLVAKDVGDNGDN